MPSVTMRLAHDRFSLDAEATFIYLTQRSPDFDGVFLGHEFGVYLNAAAIAIPELELRGGAGGDFYYLWGINGDELQAALSVKAAVHVWPIPELGLFASLRTYLVSGDGLELGTTRDHEERLPLLVATGLEWRSEAWH